jgi:hypothetical protein
VILLERLKSSHFAFLCCIAALQGAVVSGPFMARALLSNDALGSYGLFYDNLDSLNRFGGPAWWASHVNWGTPTYFFALLGIPNLGKPAFVSIGAVAWILGRVGIQLPFVYPIYAFYLSVLIPFLLLLGVWLVAREIFRSPAAIRYTLVVAAAPAFLLDLADPGITENSAYGLMCAAAYLRFVAMPSRRRFWVLCASALLVSIGTSAAIMISSIPMLGMLVFASLLVSGAARHALRSVRLADAIAAVALLFATASPSIIAYVQQGDRFVSRTIGSLDYSYGALKAGNPLVLLLAGLPVPMAWDSYQQSPTGPLSQMHVRSLDRGERVGSHLGLLALPLAATGLVFGRRRVRAPLFVMLVVAGAVLIPFASSPILAPLLVAFPVLGTYNHFGDQFYDGCAFLVLLFAAGLGLEAAERQRSARCWLSVAFVGFGLIALPLFLRLGDPPARLGGFLALMAACFATLLVWVVRLPQDGRSRRLLGVGVVALTLIDVGGGSLWTVRPVLRASSHVTDTGLGRRIGSADPDVNVTTENYALKATDALSAAGVDLTQLPYVEGFCAAHLSRVPPMAADVVGGFGERRSLAMPVSSLGAPALAPFLSARPDGCNLEILGVRRDYNSIQIAVRAAQPALVFVKDGWSPGWRAEVNGSESEILPALGAFKAVAVPAGASAVLLRFSPSFVGAALLGSYALLVAVGIAVFGFGRRFRDSTSARAASAVRA